MPAKLEWHHRARRDLLAIVDYISDDNLAAAQQLKNEVEAKAARLPLRPHLYRRGRVPGTREAVIRPNYILVYSVTKDEILVLRILHAAQKWPPDEI